MMCAIESGYMSLSIHDAPCTKCFVISKGENVVHHHGTWKCVKPEVDHAEFQRLWLEREKRLKAFRWKYEKKCPRCGGTGTQEERLNGQYVTSCVGCWLPYMEWDTWKEPADPINGDRGSELLGEKV